MNLLDHKKARLNYEIVEEFEAGIKLTGPEVKSLRAGQGKLEGSHVIVRPTALNAGLEAYIVGMHIAQYQPGNSSAEFDTAATRKLLLKKKELVELSKAEAQKGLTLVPLTVYNSGRNIKVRVAVARGRKKHDKREVLKKRDAKREIERTLKNQ